MNDRLDSARAEKLVVSLTALGKAQGLYPKGHAAEERALTAAQHAMADALAEGVPVLLGEADGYVVVGDVPFLSDGSHVKDLERWFKAGGVEGVLCHPGVSRDELSRFSRWMIAGGSSPWKGRHIRVTLLEKEAGWERAVQAYGAAMDAMEEAHREAEQGRIPDPDRARACVQSFSTLLGESPSVLHGLVLIKDYDRYTFHHSVNVSLLSLGLGQHFGLTPAEQEALGLGGLFHDIGKTRTPTEVVRKPGRLTEREWELVRQHPAQGRSILLEIGGVPTSVSRMAHEHHRWFDGSGYPGGADGQEVHPLSRLVAVADAYDAMTTHRSYSRPMPLPEAVAVVKTRRGTQFDPRASDGLLAVLGAIPVGSVVRLAAGEVGVVASLNDRGEVGKVRVVVSARGERLASAHRPERAVAPGEVVGWVNPLTHGIDPVEVLHGGKKG